MGSVLLFSITSAPTAFALKMWWHKNVDLIVHHPFINMRTGPGRGFPVFHVVEKGEVLTITKRRGDWYKAVDKKGVKGWVKREKLNNALTPNGEILAFSSPGWDEYVNRKREIGILPFGDFSGAQSFTILTSYHFTPNIAAQVRYGYNYGDFSNSQLATLSIVNQPFTEWKISPFFMLGTGVLYVEPDTNLVQSEDRFENVMTVGGGLLYYVSRRFILRVEYNDHTVLTNRANNEEVDEWKAGFSVFF